MVNPMTGTLHRGNDIGRDWEVYPNPIKDSPSQGDFRKASHSCKEQFSYKGRVQVTQLIW